MPKRENEPLVRKHVILFQSDWDRIEEEFQNRSVGASYAIRTIVRAYFRRIDEEVNSQSNRLSVELSDEDLQA
jgi:hypothetical protein